MSKFWILVPVNKNIASSHYPLEEKEGPLMSNLYTRIAFRKEMVSSHCSLKGKKDPLCPHSRPESPSMKK